MMLRDILSLAPVIPVLTVHHADDAVPLVRALAEGGLKTVEITLRTGAALDAIRAAAAEVESSIIGAGTVLESEDLERAGMAGARFAVSPGATPELLRAAAGNPIPLLPGAATASEIMQLSARGFTTAKFFPAEPSGGVAALKAFSGPFPEMRFCPTGGIGPGNAQAYLSLPNVLCVGGSWVVPDDALAVRDWSRITALAREAAAIERPTGSAGAGSSDRTRRSGPRI